ncbi:MAG: helix-turn-helix transcriptional regulator [Treponema sp.]|jgi:transcriptional regulator with XRE-family HTH domain|nr:helix-turn-helix transcriptional regulator [Treponema sp.]
MVNIREVLAVNLKKNRRKKGLTQEKLAEQADMSLQYLALLELARKFPSGEMLERLAAALDVEPHELFSVETSPEDALTLLRQDIVSEMGQLAANIERLIGEAVKKAIAENCPYKPHDGPT